LAGQPRGPPRLSTAMPVPTTIRSGVTVTTTFGSCAEIFVETQQSYTLAEKVVSLFENEYLYKMTLTNCQEQPLSLSAVSATGASATVDLKSKSSPFLVSILSFWKFPHILPFALFSLNLTCCPRPSVIGSFVLWYVFFNNFCC